MAAPTRQSITTASIIQPDYVFNPGAPIPRDQALLHYNQPYFRTRAIRRVAILDSARRALLLTTPMRVMAAWHARDSNARPHTPYLAIVGWQHPIPDNFARKYLDTLQAGLAGGIVSVAASATINAVRVADTPSATVNNIESVLEGISQHSACWLPMFADNLTGVDAGTAFLSDTLDFSPPSALQQSGTTVLLLREEEADIAMASPMIALEEGQMRDGIQFRGGYGALWDPAATHVQLNNPLYSPTHRIPALNRVWTFGGPCTTSAT